MTLWEQAVRYKWKTKSAKPIAKHDMAHPSGYPLLLSKGSPTSPLSTKYLTVLSRKLCQKFTMPGGMPSFLESHLMGSLGMFSKAS